MPWLKYELSYAECYGPPKYVEVDGTATSLEDARSEIMAEHFDGVRTPRFKVIDRLPEEEIARRFARAKSDLRNATAALVKYATMLSSQEGR